VEIEFTNEQLEGFLNISIDDYNCGGYIVGSCGGTGGCTMYEYCKYRNKGENK
jgi:hypothetical protein